ncbi:hypothetical protein OMW55_08300 [Sphingomonas sp. BN140010]|uniref:Uncharacterized protein n=1 Tax=Sphingomonas arvum TaxID=2992113 RepID=A0ABT3JFF6_9SPHN|nr:hypothetical protein [Sphingomonas sp. BN140010]MCW3797802.1 hypothetical protein [Sphingomonas sp. BN140010]
MTRTLILALAGTAATMAATAPVAAQQWSYNERGWRTVGYSRVDGRDNDTIRLPGVTRQRAIRICSLNAPLRLRDFDVRFANGGSQDVNTRAVLPAGRCTRAVDLRGNRRDVEAVRLRYEPILRNAARPVVRVQVR